MASYPLTSPHHFLNVQRRLVSGQSIVHKYGRLPDIDDADGALAVWPGTKGPYLGFDATAGEAVESFSAQAADAGTVLSSGTLTSGSATTAVDSAADFVTDTVAAGDVVVNDTTGDHAVITTVAATTLTFRRWRYGTTPASTHAYRVVTAASTGAALLRLEQLLDVTTGVASAEYIVLNGATGVDTTGTNYFRCSRSRVVLAGSGNGNAGALTVRQKTTTANIFQAVPIGYNASMVAAFTIPGNRTGYLLGWHLGLVGTGGATHTGRILARPTGEVFQVREELTIRGGGVSNIQRTFGAPKGQFPAWTDVYVDTNSDIDNSAATAGMDFFLTDD